MVADGVSKYGRTIVSRGDNFLYRIGGPRDLCGTVGTFLTLSGRRHRTVKGTKELRVRSIFSGGGIMRGALGALAL